METNLKKIDASKAELSVELDQDDLRRSMESAMRMMRAELRIDGFRKGKVPEDMARKHIDNTEVREQALQDALRESLARVVSERKLDVASVSDLAIKENGPARLHYTVVLHLYPEMRLPDLKSVKAERRTINVEAAEVEETLETVRHSRATFHHKDGAAQDGDRVEIDFEVRLNGKPIEGGQSKNHPLIIGGKSFLPGFEEHIIGMREGEERTFAFSVPENYYHAGIAGKTLEAVVKLNSLQSVQTPELNDDLARQVGSFQNLEQLKGSIREGLYEEKRLKEKQRLRLAILDQIIAKTSVALPASLIEEQLDAMVASFDHDLHERGLELGVYLSHLGKTQDDLRKDWRSEAERQTKIKLAIHKISVEKNIEPSPEEVAAALEEQLQNMTVRNQIDPSEIDTGELRRAIAERLTSEKTLNFIEGVCAGT